MKSFLFFLPLCLCAAPSVLVIDDFESPGAESRWSGALTIDTSLASHGGRSARVTFSGAQGELNSRELVRDWRGYDRLLFDVHNPGDGIRTLTVRIYDEVGGDAGKAAKYDYFEARRKVLLQHGWNHVEIRLTPLAAASFTRN